jgi:hypothetical protein
MQLPADGFNGDLEGNTYTIMTAGTMKEVSVPDDM